MLSTAKLVTTFFIGIGDRSISSILTHSEIQTLAKFGLCCLVDLNPLGAALLRLRTCAIIAAIGRQIVDEWSSPANLELVHQATQALTDLVILLRNGMPLSTTNFPGESLIQYLRACIFFYLQCCRMILAIIHNISEAFLIGFILKLVSINTTFWGFLGSYSTISLLLDHLFAICTATSMLLVTWYACYFDARFIKMKIEMITHINWTGSCLQNLMKQKSIVDMRNVSGIWWNSSVLWSAIGNRYPKTCVVILSNIFDCFFFQHDSLKAVVNWKKIIE